MRSNKGLTFIELIIVVAVVAILAAIAIPVYTSYMQRGRRADAKTALQQLAAAQEMRRAEKGSYSTNLTELQTSWGVQANPVGDYKLQWAGGAFVLTGNSFTAQAAPDTARQMSDGSLFINNLGQKWDAQGVYYPNGKWAQ
ncbi:MAG: type IV pilin protein [bacterium]